MDRRRSTGTTLTMLAVVGLALGAWPRPMVAASSAAMPSDFNGDGIADLAIGAPGEAVGNSGRFAGAVNVLYGRPSGLSAIGDQLWTQDSPGVPGRSEGSQDFGDQFGSVVASGDFDSDSYADLAIGVPGERLRAVESEGAVTILYGTSAGLTSSGSRTLTQGGRGATDHQISFGEALAAADFDRDGYVDLAVVATDGDELPWSVQVVYGGPSGLTGSGSHQITPASDGIPPLEVNSSGLPTLASGDLDGDGYADLALGLPTAATSMIDGAGAVIVIYGGPAGLDDAPGELWSQDTPGVLDFAESPYDIDYEWETTLDRFGSALAIGDFDMNGFDDLAVGVPGEDVNGTCRMAEDLETCHGAVNVLYGSSDGLTADGNQFWHQDSSGVPGKAEQPDAFGASLAAADFDGDGSDDLAIGLPVERIGRKGFGEGAVITLRGGLEGLTAVGSRLWTQDTPGLLGRSESFDYFGSTLAAANYGRSGRADLVIGVPGERLPHAERRTRNGIAAGYVNVLYGGTAGLGAAGSQGWSQDSAGVKGRAENEDSFGSSLSP